MLQMKYEAKLKEYRPYFTFNREERNLAAIFYHVLLINNNLEKFLTKLKVEYPIIPEEMGIYFDYAYLRDLWFEYRHNSNDFKKKLILD